MELRASNESCQEAQRWLNEKGGLLEDGSENNRSFHPHPWKRKVMSIIGSLTTRNFIEHLIHGHFNNCSLPRGAHGFFRNGVKCGHPATKHSALPNQVRALPKPFLKVYCGCKTLHVVSGVCFFCYGYFWLTYKPILLN